jgi:hypothetical protein
MAMVEGDKGSAKVCYCVEWEVGDFTLVNHSVRHKITHSKACDKSEIDRVQFHDDVDGHNGHARQKI